MKKEIAERWVAALRSGEYKQGRHALRIGDAYCRMGVLCAIAVQDGAEVTHATDANGVTFYDGNNAGLPSSVVIWAGMETCNGEWDPMERNLVARNDYGSSFRQIANTIEANWERL